MRWHGVLVAALAVAAVLCLAEPCAAALSSSDDGSHGSDAATVALQQPGGEAEEGSADALQGVDDTIATAHGEEEEEEEEEDEGDIDAALDEAAQAMLAMDLEEPLELNFDFNLKPATGDRATSIAFNEAAPAETGKKEEEEVAVVMAEKEGGKVAEEREEKEEEEAKVKEEVKVKEEEEEEEKEKKEEAVVPPQVEGATSRHREEDSVTASPQPMAPRGTAATKEPRKDAVATPLQPIAASFPPSVAFDFGDLDEFQEGPTVELPLSFTPPPQALSPQPPRHQRRIAIIVWTVLGTSITLWCIAWLRSKSRERRLYAGDIAPKALATLEPPPVPKWPRRREGPLALSPTKTQQRREGGNEPR